MDTKNRYFPVAIIFLAIVFLWVAIFAFSIFYGAPALLFLGMFACAFCMALLWLLLETL